MKPIVIFEIAGAIFVGIALIGQLNNKDKTKAAKWLRIALILFMIHLIVDALAYTLAGPSYPFSLRYAVNLLAYSISGIDMMVFIMYCNVFISSKVNVNQKTFLIPMIAAGMCTLASAVLFIAGKLIVYENEIAVMVNDIPLWLRLFEILILLYTPAIILRYRKEIGWKAAILLELYGLTPVIAGIMAIFVGADYTIIMGAVDVLLVASVVQNEEQREQLQKAFEKEKESNRIIGALSEDYTVINYVELTDDENDDIGISYRASDTFKKIVPNADDLGFTAKILALSDTAVYEPDREQFYRDTRRNVVMEALSDSDTYTLYPRLLINGEIEYYEMKFSAIRECGNITAVVVGLRSINEEKKKELEAKKRLEEQMALSDGLAREYHTVWLMDGFGNHNLHLYRSTGKTTVQSAVQLGLEQPCFDTSVVKYIKDNVLPEDQERVIEETRFEIIVRETPEVGTYVVTYRRFTENRTNFTYHQMCFARAVATDGSINYILAYRDADKIIRDQMEAQQKRLLGAMPLSNDVLTKANIGMWAFELDEGQPPRMYDDETMLGLVGLDHQVPPEESYHAWYDHIDEGSYDLVNDAVAKMIDGEHAEVQYPWHYPDGRTIIVRCGGVRNFDYKKGIRIEGTHQNVTETLHFDEEERKREEQQREDEIARAKAEAADKAKTEFLFNMSHDIRTPMNAIIGFTEKAIKHKEEPQVFEESLEKVKSSSEYLLGIVNDILDMAKIESGRIELHDELYFVNENGNSLIEVFGAEAARKGIEFHTEYDIQDEYFWVDDNRVSQIVANIISNAIKYTESGDIWYTFRQIPCDRTGYGKYICSVEDTGCGMSKDFLKKIFDAFERDSSAIRNGAQGTGLGMAIVKKLIDAMGGTIDIQSELGKGTKVSFTLENRLATPEEIDAYQATENDSTDVSIDFAGKKVLLVEDNELNREIAIDILEEEGLDVEDADDGTKAVEKLKEKGPDYYDFILMDIQMPLMNGYEATKLIRTMYPDARLPIIALSANAFEEDKQKSFEAGMDDHVAKPINVKELLDALAKYL